jgi:hypothetical protein
MRHAAGMAPDNATTIPVIDFRRHSMVLQWHALAGTWTACDNPPQLVHGIALIRASHHLHPRRGQFRIPQALLRRIEHRRRSVQLFLLDQPTPRFFSLVGGQSRRS